VDGDDGKKEHTPCINHSSEPLSIIVHEGRAVDTYIKVINFLTNV